jgi:hypothetical protein
MPTPEQMQKAREARRRAPTRRQRMAAFAGTFTKQRERFPRTALPLIAKAESGSLPAAIKLMCLDCTAWQRKEVRDCVIDWCPLYPHRPYQAIRGRDSNDPPTGAD